jgi:hypothetical protein
MGAYLPLYFNRDMLLGHQSDPHASCRCYLFSRQAGYTTYYMILLSILPGSVPLDFQLGHSLHSSQSNITSYPAIMPVYYQLVDLKEAEVIDLSCLSDFLVDSPMEVVIPSGVAL